MGMVLYEMLTLKLPYEDVGLFDVRQHVLQGAFIVWFMIILFDRPLTDSIGSQAIVPPCPR